MFVTCHPNFTFIMLALVLKSYGYFKVHIFNGLFNDKAGVSIIVKANTIAYIYIDRYLDQVTKIKRQGSDARVPWNFWGLSS